MKPQVILIITNPTNHGYSWNILKHPVACVFFGIAGIIRWDLLEAVEVEYVDHHVHIPVQTHRHVTVEKRMQRTARDHGRTQMWWWNCWLGMSTLWYDCYYWEFHHHWRSHIFFQRGRYTTNQIIIIITSSSSFSSFSSSSSSSVCTWPLCRIYFMCQARRICARTMAYLCLCCNSCLVSWLGV